MNIFPLLPTKIRKKHDIAAKNDRKSNQSIKKSLKTGKESRARDGGAGGGRLPEQTAANNEHPATPQRGSST